MPRIPCQSCNSSRQKLRSAKATSTERKPYPLKPPIVLEAVGIWQPGLISLVPASAHVASHEEEAGLLFASARAAASAPKLQRIAALGELLAAIELENADAPDLLRALEMDDEVDPTERLILADRRISFETHLALEVDVERARASAQLVPLVGDPLVRTSFRNVFGYTLAATGHFEEALDLTEDQLADADHHRLEFVVPYAHAVQALAKAGLRSI